MQIIKTLWQTFWKPSSKLALGTLLILGFIVGILFWGAFNWAVEASNTEAFCISCHEMRDNVYKEYKETAHYNNSSGVRAICSDCHVPKEWVYKMARKIRATNELYHHFMGTVDTPEKFEIKRLELAQNVWDEMKANDSRECRNCHAMTFMDLKAQTPRARAQHESSVEDGETCIDCHKGLAHKPVHEELESEEDDEDFTF
jgi:nitrate/TMAO reductase-like tetraheme cytochrome c subunit